jgi:hypothetical protein
MIGGMGEMKDGGKYRMRDGQWDERWERKMKAVVHSCIPLDLMTQSMQSDYHQQRLQSIELISLLPLHQ